MRQAYFLAPVYLFFHPSFLYAIYIQSTVRGDHEIHKITWTALVGSLVVVSRHP